MKMQTLNKIHRKECRRSFVNSITLITVLGLPAAAQTTPTYTTCTTAPASLSSMSIERVVPLQNVLSTFNPNVPGSIIASILAGALEVRERVVYNPQASTLTQTYFLVATGSPLPTPLSFNVAPVTFDVYTIAINQVLFGCKPVPNVMFLGTLSTPPNGPWGDINGVAEAFAVGYTTDNPPKINNITELRSGFSTSWTSNAVGTLTFPVPPPVVPPSTPPTIVLNPAMTPNTVTQVYFSPYYGIDASKSTDAKGLALTYQWSSPNTVSFSPSTTSATPLLTFQGGYGDYPITLVVTNSAGLSSTITFILQYVR